MIDGYRVMFAYPNDDYFVNLKVERSDPSRYEGDKATIIQQMQLMSAQAKGVQVPVEHAQFRHYDLYGLNNPAVVGSQMAFYSLFDDKKHAVVSIYFLNQKPEHRSFQTVEEFHVQRDRFFDRYFTCVSENG